MTRYFGAVFLVLLTLLTFYQSVNAAETSVPEPFRGFDNDSQQSINYDDLSDLLRNVVLEVRFTNRTFSDPIEDITGTRLKARDSRKTAHEGNRFHYETFIGNEAAQQYLLNIQASLEQLPAEVGLENFSRDEQLAYWLNLYNVTVLNQVIAVYPKRSLKRLSNGRKSMFTRKLLNVAGVPLSLDDIQFTILAQNYDNNPLILYGLYQGVIGGPDIRGAAYAGYDVYQTLEENAYQFINSNRGTFARDEGDFGDITFFASSFYERNSSFFPDFETDLAEHLLTYLEGDLRDRLQAAARIKANIEDWTVTDLGGTRQQIGGSLANNQAALLDSYKSNRRSINGGTLTATLVLKKEEQTDEEPEMYDTASAPVETSPVEGASIEDLSVE